MNKYFDHIIFDVDSTLCAIEGVDELARWRGCLDQVATLTDLAMNGQLDFETALEKRLNLIQPHAHDLERLTDLYLENLTAGTLDTIRELLQHDCQVHIVSGGYTQALTGLASTLNLPIDHIHAIDLQFDADGTYLDFDHQNPLCKPSGKQKKLHQLRAEFPNQTFAVIGDGMSDAETRDIVDRFICFAGHIQRLPVMKLTPWLVLENDLRKILPYVLLAPEVTKPIHQSPHQWG